MQPKNISMQSWKLKKSKNDGPLNLGRIKKLWSLNLIGMCIVPTGQEILNIRIYVLVNFIEQQIWKVGDWKFETGNLEIVKPASDQQVTNQQQIAHDEFYTDHNILTVDNS